MGNQLQFKDSQIAEKVMLHFAKQDIAILPVHDSFVIQRSLKPELIEVMSEAFSQHYDVPIDIKDGAKFLAMDIGLPDEVKLMQLSNTCQSLMVGGGEMIRWQG